MRVSSTPTNFSAGEHARCCSNSKQRRRSCKQKEMAITRNVFPEIIRQAIAFKRHLGILKFCAE